MPTQTETELFDHSSAPKGVKPHGGTRSKYRDDEDYQPLPISSDPRVVRGSTTVLARKVASNRKTVRAKTLSKSNDDYDVQLPRATYSYDVQGHVGPDVDLSSYLIAADDGVGRQMKEKSDQTDSFRERPQSPAYVPRKTGIDNTTQVEDVRELFDFDAESQPIVDVIVSKTLEQAIFEVRHEEELLALEAVERQFEEEKVKEAALNKQKEDLTKAEYMEHKAKVKSQSELKEAERKMKMSVAGIQAMKQVLPGVFENVVEDLYNNNTWRRPERAEVEDEVMKGAKEESIRRRYKTNFEATRMVDEMLLECSRLYEERTTKRKDPVNDRMVTLVLKAKQPEAGADEVPKAIKLEPVKIWGPVSVITAYAALKESCADQEYVTEVTMTQLHTFFRNIVGRDVARDGALIRFGKYMKDKEEIEV